jgi:hypothetical protein
MLVSGKVCADSTYKPGLDNRPFAAVVGQPSGVVL